MERMREIKQARLDAIEILRAEGEEAFAESEYYRMPERTSGTDRPRAVRVPGAGDCRQSRRSMGRSSSCTSQPGSARVRSSSRPLRRPSQSARTPSFYGHTHTYDHTERLGRDYINLATTGGAQDPKKGRSMDHLMLVTVDDTEVSIAVLLMEGILNKTGRIPLDGEKLDFEKSLEGGGR